MFLVAYVEQFLDQSAGVECENSQKSTIYQKKGMLFLQKHSAQTFRTKDIKYRKIIYIYIYTLL